MADHPHGRRELDDFKVHLEEHSKQDIEFQKLILEEQKRVSDALVICNKGIDDYHLGLTDQLNNLNNLLKKNTDVTNQNSDILKYLTGASTFFKVSREAAPGVKWMAILVITLGAAIIGFKTTLAFITNFLMSLTK